MDSVTTGSVASASLASVATDASNAFMPTCRWNLMQFGLMCVYTMGYTAIWKFPFLVYSHTGLFLVAYYSLLVVVCIPVAFLQLKLGGVIRKGIVGIFSHFCPALKGVAVALLLVAFIQVIYHAVYLSYSLYYMFMAFPQPFVWSHPANATLMGSSSHVYFEHAQNPAEHYYYNMFLQVTESLSVPGTMPWYLGACHLATWSITYLFVFRGPGWFGKVVYASSPLTIGFLFGLLIYSHTAVPSSSGSLRYFFAQNPSIDGEHVDGQPNDDVSILNSQLASPLTWIRALEQHVYSLGLWSGILPTLGSNLGNKKPASNLTWLIVLLVHSMLPHLGTIAIAPFIHALAVHKHRNFDQVINSGPYLLFVVLPEAFQLCEISPIWVCVLYICFFLFVMHQQALFLVVIAENIAECFPEYAPIVFRRRECLLAALCAVGCLFGLPHMLQGGSYLTQLVELYLYRIIFVLITFSIIPFVVAYARLNSLHMPIERVCMCIWFAASSFATAGLLVYNLIMFLQPYTNQLQDLPMWGHWLGWALAVAPFLFCLIGGFLHALAKAEGDTTGQRLIAMVKPASNSIPFQHPDEMDPDAMLECQEGGGTLRLRKKAKKKNPIAGGVPMVGASELADNVELLSGSRAGSEDERGSQDGEIETPGTPKSPLMNPQTRQLLNELHLTFEKKAKDSPQNERRQPDLIPEGPEEEEPYFPKPSHIKKRPSDAESTESGDKPKPKIVKRKPQTHPDGSDEEREIAKPLITLPVRKGSSSSGHQYDAYEDIQMKPLTSPATKQPPLIMPLKHSNRTSFGQQEPTSPTNAYHKAQKTPTSPLSPTGSQGSPGPEKPKLPNKSWNSSDISNKAQTCPPPDTHENVPKLPAKTSKKYDKSKLPPPPPDPPCQVEEYMDPILSRKSSASSASADETTPLKPTRDSPPPLHPRIIGTVAAAQAEGDNIAYEPSLEEHLLVEEEHPCEDPPDVAYDDGNLYEDVGVPLAEGNAGEEVFPDEDGDEQQDKEVDLMHDYVDEDEGQEKEESEDEGDNVQQHDEINGYDPEEFSGEVQGAIFDDGTMDADESVDAFSTTAEGGQSGDELLDDTDLANSVADSTDYPPGYDQADFTIDCLAEEGDYDIGELAAQNGLNGGYDDDDNIYEDVEAPPLPARQTRGPSALNGHGRHSLNLADPVGLVDDSHCRRSYHGEDPRIKLRMEVCIPPPDDSAVARV